MKAILLAGGKGTRLRPLTIHTPKPIVPIFDRAFLHYQIDLLKQVPEIDEVILSLNYQPRRIEEIFGDGSGTGVRIRYVVEPAPLGTGGAIRYASQGVTDTIVVFNGDVMTSVDVNRVVQLHRERAAKATIVLTPVENPTAYGLVETHDDGSVKRFLEKPKADEITCDTINAGIYVLEPETFDRIPKDVAYSIERGYFPSLVERNEPFLRMWIAATGSTSAPRKSTSRYIATCSTASSSAAASRRSSGRSRSWQRMRVSNPARDSRPLASSTVARRSRRTR
jgi:NDP-sugar pyrophosphorylase family protein